MRIAAHIVLLLSFLVLIRLAGIKGLSSLLYAYGATTNALEPVNVAVGMSPDDPDAHFTRASMLASMGELDEAIREYERAVALRPEDYVSWLELGRARDQYGDEAGALEASRQAVRLAPFYAQTHWQLGNLLFRSGRREEGFAEMRRAASGDPQLWPVFIDLVWTISGGDIQSVNRVIRPETNEARLALAKFLEERGKITEVLELLQASGEAGESERKAFLKKLLADRRFPEAYQVWAVKGETGDGGGGVANLIDGGFEEEVRLDKIGFGWQPGHNIKGVDLSLDKAEVHSGRQSLRLEFNGDSDPSSPIITQLLLVELGTRYRLHFVALTREIITGGAPVIALIDGQSDRIVAQSEPLPQNSASWKEFEIEFETKEKTSAIIISVQRQKCSDAPCPIFGRLWLDDFSLKGIPANGDGT